MTGTGRAAERAAETEEAMQKLRETMDRILSVLRETKGRRITIGQLPSRLSKPQRPYRMAALKELAGGPVPRITVVGNVVTLIG